MAVELVDDQGNPIDLEKASGSTLRTKLEEALAENRRLSERLVTLEAEKVIEAHGKGLVKPEDLKGVRPDQLEARVKELAEQRLEERKSVVREILEAQGLTGEELDAAVEDFLAGRGSTREAEPEPEDEGPSLGELSQLPGSRPKVKPKLPPMDDPMANLVSHFESRDRKRR